MLPSISHRLVEVAANIRKQANDTIGPDYIRHIIDAVTNHHVGSSLIGAGAGGMVGALAGKRNNRKKSILKGMGVGGLSGLGASVIAPETSSAINTDIANNLLAKPIGRLVTNTTYPYGYNVDNKLEQLKNAWRDNRKEIIDAVLKDKPISSLVDPDVALELEDYDTWQVRQQPFRHMFGLGPRPGESNMYATNPNGSIRLHEGMLQDMKDLIAGSVAEGKTPSSLQGTDHLVLGNYSMNLNPDGKSYHYKDRWDFDLQPHERITGTKEWKDRLVRHLVSKIVKPVTFEGDVPIPQKTM